VHARPGLWLPLRRTVGGLQAPCHPPPLINAHTQHTSLASFTHHKLVALAHMHGRALVAFSTHQTSRYKPLATPHPSDTCTLAADTLYPVFTICTCMALPWLRSHTPHGSATSLLATPRPTNPHRSQQSHTWLGVLSSVCHWHVPSGCSSSIQHPWRGLGCFPTHQWGCYKPPHPSHTQYRHLIGQAVHPYFRTCTVGLWPLAHMAVGLLQAFLPPHPSNKARACPARKKLICKRLAASSHRTCMAGPLVATPTHRRGAASPLPLPTLPQKRGRAQHISSCFLQASTAASSHCTCIAGPWIAFVTSMQHSHLHGGALVAVLHTR
jgi:hypothetical protein